MRTMIMAAVHHELGNIEGFALGVGPVRAAASAARLLALHTPSAVVLIGTAGTYRREVPVPSVIAAHKVGWGHAAAVLGAGYVPLPPEPLWTDERLRTVSGLISADVLTVGAITTDRSVAAAWSADWALENMEAYSVALAAAQAGVPFLAILGVTNEVGPDAHAQWKANRAEVEQRVRDAVHPLLSLAAG